MTAHDGRTPPVSRRAAVRDREDATVARLQQLAADLDDAPAPRFRAATRERLVAMAAVRTPRPAPRSALRRVLAARADGGPPAASRTRLTAGLAGAAMTVTALGSLAALSTDARPGDVLYGVKRGTEQTRLALAGDERGLTLLDLAQARLDELAALPAPAAADVLSLLDTMDAQTQEGTALLAAQAVDRRDTAPVDGLAGWADRQTAELTALRPDLPAEAAAAAQVSLELLNDVSGRAAGLQTALACPGGPATAGTDELGPVPAECPADAPATGTSPDEDPSDQPGGVLPGEEPPSGDAGAPADTPADSAAPAPQPAPAPAPSAPGGGVSGDRGTGPAPGSGGGTTPVAPEPPAVEEAPLPVPVLPRPVPVDPAEPGAPLLDTPLPICTRPLVC